MATNLRLDRAAEEAVRAEAQRSHRSQQQVIRDAVNRYLAIDRETAPANEYAELIATGVVRPPRTPYRTATRRIMLPAGVTTADLLDRDDRF